MKKEEGEDMKRYDQTGQRFSVKGCAAREHSMVLAGFHGAEGR